MAKSKPTKMLAVLGRCRRGGRWQPANRSSVLAVVGDCYLDMRKALVDEEQPVKFEVTVVLGSVTFVVPPGVEIRPSGMSILASSKVAVPTAEDSSFPVIEVEWNCILGRIRIISMDEVGNDLQVVGAETQPALAVAPAAQAIAAPDAGQPLGVAAEPAVVAGFGFQDISTDVPPITEVPAATEVTATEDTESPGIGFMDFSEVSANTIGAAEEGSADGAMIGGEATIGGAAAPSAPTPGIPSQELGFVDQLAA
ncbi:MAG: hypothetical protein ACRBK7_26345 [Acidimicrobiales bacterium]